MNLQSLLIGGNLILTIGQPLVVKGTGPQLWFSSSDQIEATPIQNGAILKAKHEGVVYGWGLDSQLKTPVRIVTLDSANRAALKKCPRENIEFQNSILQNNYAQAIVASECGFSTGGLNPEAQEVMQAHFLTAENAIQSAGFTVYAKSWQNGQRKLQIIGKSSPADFIKKHFANLAPFFTFENLQGVLPGNTLIFELTFFEFSKSRARALGLKLPESLNVKGAIDSSLKIKALSSNLDLGADFGESQGVGRILAQPQLRTKPGEKATFKSGGELPIKSTSPLATQTTWKPYGLTVNLEPAAGTPLGATEVTLNLEMELSEPDLASALDGIPGMIIRRLSSRFDIRTNEVTILSTMIQTRSGTRRSGIQGLTDIPILSSFTSNNSEFQTDSELWFAIKPRWDDLRVNRNQND